MKNLNLENISKESWKMIEILSKKRNYFEKFKKLILTTTVLQFIILNKVDDEK
jgi:hypothetical protein